MSPVVLIFAISDHYYFLVPVTSSSKLLLKRDLLIQVLKPDTAGPLFLQLEHDSTVEKGPKELSTNLFIL